MKPFLGLRKTPLGEMTPGWRATVAALPVADRARLAAEADALYEGGERDGRRRALWCYLALKDHLDPSDAADAPRARALLLGLPPGLADVSELAHRSERRGGRDLRHAASIHLGRVGADGGDLSGAEARFRSVLGEVRGEATRIEYMACSSLAHLFLRQSREYEALVLSRRLVGLGDAPSLADPTMRRYALLCLAEALERLEEWTLLATPLEAIALSLDGTPVGYERTVRSTAALVAARAAMGLGDLSAAGASIEKASSVLATGTPIAGERRPLLLLRGRLAMERRSWGEAAVHIEASLEEGGRAFVGAAEARALLVACLGERDGDAAAAGAARELLRLLDEEGTAAHGSGGVLSAATLAASALASRGSAVEVREDLLRVAAGAALLRVLEIDRCVREIPEAATVSPEDTILLRAHRARFIASHQALLESVRRRLAAEHRAGRRPLVRLRPEGGPLRACAWCARLLAPDGKWIPVAHLVPPGLENPVTHGICPECAAEHFPGFPLDRASGG